MNNKERFRAGLLLLILSGLAYVWLSPSGLQNAPSVTLQTLKGQQLTLSDWQGKPVILTFWATTCPGCIKEMPHLVELYEQLHDQGLEVLGIAMAYDPPNQVATLVKARQLPYTIALDLDGKAAEAFGKIRLTPTTFLISPEGKIVHKKIGELNMEHIRATIKQMLDNTNT
ncbi:MAG: TlpA family protein disulfide reductase [Gammaproteobacteria bacterium]|nr:TlpA family protein disulfide reductase [Gammaproteobacteria bacterium]